MTSEGTNRQPQEASIKLFDRTDGSFLNPAPSATAEHCIEFWTHVEIPDEIIDQVFDAYAKDRKEEIDSDMDQAMAQWREQWVADNPAPRGGRQLEDHQARYTADFEQHRLSILPGIVAKRPEGLGQYDARQLIRTTKMIINRPHPSKFPGESDKVLAEKIELFDEELTVMEIERKYRLSRVRIAMEKIFRNDTEALLRAVESQSEELAGIREQLVYLRNEMAE
jgi:hypothetical protein